MLIAVLTGFLFSIALIFGGRFIKGKFSLVASLVPLSLFIYFLQFIDEITAGKTITQNNPWVPSFGINLDFRLDGLSLLFCLLITGIGFLVFGYTSAYLKRHHYLDRFYGYLSSFMAAMLGLVLSDNVISIFVFWELTSIASFFLIGFNNQQEGSRKSALTALGITGVGGLFLLAGGTLLQNISGSYNISEMIGQSEVIAQSPLYILAVCLIFGAAFTKSAQFPFHFWLPGAMKAPTPVSTYLHSATMVKAGIYLLLRMTPVLGDQPFWNNTLMIVGGITMFYSAFHGLFRTDMKGILAYTTISALGILVFTIGIGTEAGILAASVFIVVHALYKATLFLITGAVDHAAHTRDVTQLSGLRKVMWPVALASLLAVISNAGIPPSIGFVGKDLIYEGTLHLENGSTVLIIIAILTNVFIAYAGYAAGLKPFIGKLPDKYSDLHFPEFWMWFPALFLGVFCFVFGLFPELIQDSIIKPLVRSAGFSGEGIHLKLWHGITPILGLSAITIFSGIGLYLLVKPSHKIEASIQKLEFMSPKSFMEHFNYGFRKFSRGWTSFFQNGYLRNYVSMIILLVVVLIATTLLKTSNYNIDWSTFSELTTYEVIVVGIMLTAIVFTVAAKTRIVAVAATGVMGYCICLMFVFYSAPDLAMTQFAIDTLTVVLFVLVLYKLPKYLTLSDYKARIRDGVLSIAFGGLISILALEVLDQPVNDQISEFYAKNSYTMAHGKNVVNVILVDFRGADTMIEISVLSIAAIGVFALLKLRLKSAERDQR